MRKINKQNCPASFDLWLQKKPSNQNENQWYQTLFTNRKWDVIADLSLHNSQEQNFLCAYCCTRISGESLDTKNEHVVARSIAPNRSLDFTNIVASCKNRTSCDATKENKALPLTPLMDECETELKFKISGRVEGLTDRAKESIKVLNLGSKDFNNHGLIEKRKQLSPALLWTNGINPDDGLEDDELIKTVIEDLLTPKNGCLAPFAPVVVNILKGWLEEA